MAPRIGPGTGPIRTPQAARKASISGLAASAGLRCTAPLGKGIYCSVLTSNQIATLVEPLSSSLVTCYTPKSIARLRKRSRRVDRARQEHLPRRLCKAFSISGKEMASQKRFSFGHRESSTVGVYVVTIYGSSRAKKPTPAHTTGT